jgi:hypothetical protein
MHVQEKRPMHVQEKRPMHVQEKRPMHVQRCGNPVSADFGGLWRTRHSGKLSADL